MFNKIDKMYCINLLSRNDRYEQVCKELDALGVLNDVYFHRMNEHPKGGAYGVFEAHMWCINDAADNGYENILIFEDDLKLCCDIERYKSNEAVVNNIIDTNDFDCINLGYVHALYAEEDYGNYCLGKYTVTTAAIWNRRFIEQVAYFKPNEQVHTFDDYFCYKLNKSYFLKKPFFIQRISKSDNPWDNGQEKYKKIWEDINIRKTIDYEAFQKENHNLAKDKRGKLAHFLHIFIKYYLVEKQADSNNENTVTEDITYLFIKLLDALEQDFDLDFDEKNHFLKSAIQVIVSDHSAFAGEVREDEKKLAIA